MANQNHPSIIALQAANEAIWMVVRAGLLRDDDHPWYTRAGAHPADEALDRGEETPEWAEQWLGTFAAALHLAAPGRGRVTLTDEQRAGW